MTLLWMILAFLAWLAICCACGAVVNRRYGKGSADRAPGSPVRCGASAGVLTCALPRHGGDRHKSPEGACWYGGGGGRG